MLRKGTILDWLILLALVFLVGSLLAGWSRAGQAQPAPKTPTTVHTAPTPTPAQTPTPGHVVQKGYVFRVCLGSEPLSLEEVGASTARYIRTAVGSFDGSGPYVIREWTAGERVVLERNPWYHRASEGLPYFDFLIFRFVGDNPYANTAAVLSGECDLIDSTAGLSSQEVLLEDLQDARQLLVIGSIPTQDFAVARPDICNIETFWGQVELFQHIDQFAFGPLCGY